MAFEVIEAAGPQPPVRFQPVVDLPQGLTAGPIETPLGVDSRVDKTSLPQDAQMFGYRGLTQSEPVNQLSHRALVVPEEVDDAPAVGFGEHLKN
jgi:hypothetical protein